MSPSLFRQALYRRPAYDVCRARRKVENENNNVLKTKGYHLEHNYGYGHQFLSTALTHVLGVSWKTDG